MELVNAFNMSIQELLSNSNVRYFIHHNIASQKMHSLGIGIEFDFLIKKKEVRPDYDNKFIIQSLLFCFA